MRMRLFRRRVRLITAWGVIQYIRTVGITDEEPLGRARAAYYRWLASLPKPGQVLEFAPRKTERA